jgi:hypothetical protein
MIGHDRRIMMAKSWGKNLLLFLLLSLVDAVMIGLAWVLAAIDYVLNGSAAKFTIAKAVAWVFAFPGMVSEQSNPQLSTALMWTSPLIYGATWWLAWRMWTLFRRKAE